MAKWNKNTSRPDIKSINGGKQITPNTHITADLMNMIVRMLLYIKYRGTNG